MSEKDIGYQWLQVSVAGVPYRWAIDPEQYVERDIVDFAPRAGGGDVAYANLDLYQIYTQDSWHHGFGFIQARDKFGYRITDGDMDTRHIGMVMQATGVAIDYAYGGAPPIHRVVDFKGDTYFAANDRVWKRAALTGTWSMVYNASGKIVNDLLSNGDYLIAAIADSRMVTSQNGTSWSNAGPTGNPPENFTHLSLHGGFMWGSEVAADTRTLTGTSAKVGTVAAGEATGLYGTGGKFQSELKRNDIIKVGATLTAKVTQISSDTILSMYVLVGATLTGGETIVRQTGGYYSCLHFWAASDSSDAEGGGIADIAAIVIGAGSEPINGISSFNGSMYAGRPDGVWVVDETVSPPISRRVVDFGDERNFNNCRVFIPWKGRLYFNIGNTLYAYTGSSMINVTPPTYSLDFPPESFGRYGYVTENPSSQEVSFPSTYRGSYLYLCAKSNDSVSSGAILAFDGTGWHKVLDRLVGVPSIGFSVNAGGLFLDTYTDIGHPYPGIIRVQEGSELPYSYFDTTVGRNYIDLSEIDAGFRRVPKSFAEIDLEAVCPTGTSIVPYYYDSGQLSGNPPAWTRLGSVSTSGVSILNFSPTHEDYKLLVRLYFQTTDATKSAILRNITVKYMLRPSVLYGHKLIVLGADEVHMLDGRTLKASSEVQRQWLKDARASRAPVSFVTPFGEQRIGYISTLQFGNLQRRPGEARSNWVCVINVVEVR